MRKLKHPIAMFVIAVLVVMGVGVALMSGLPSQPPVLRTYGSPPLRFEAAFPSAVGRPVVREPDSGFLFTLACSKSEVVSVNGVDMSAVGSNGGQFFSYTSFCPLARLEVSLPSLAGRSITTTGEYSTLRTALVCKSFLLRPTQAVHLCQGGESIFTLGVNWDVEIYGPTPRVVEQFLRSFKPLPIAN
ncbi:MAG: hypothetical protein WAV54_06390 [Acidimicrobiales bacterium]